MIIPQGHDSETLFYNETPDASVGDQCLQDPF